MKTISVREAAAALGISTRAVLYRREKGHLKGVLTKNNGVDEYRIYPNKEIIEGLRKIGSPLLTDAEFANEDDRSNRTETATVDPIIDTLAARVQELEAALKRTGIESDGLTVEDLEELHIVETLESEPDFSAIEPTQSTNLSNDSRVITNSVVEAIWESLICKFQEKLEQKDQEIGTIRAELADKDRQLKLLPDLQKRAQEEQLRAEAERRAAELKSLEAEALQKQIDAMQTKQVATEQVERKVEELEHSLSEVQRKAEEEVERLKQEKEAEVAAVQVQLQRLSSTIAELKRPLWKKWFLPKPRE